MSPQSNDCAGWFGKIPAAGDFLSRGLPRGFLEPWDEWLSRELVGARSRLGERWAMSYRQAPPCCFALGAGVIDPWVWRGVLVPSCDRVGREFPLTIVSGSVSQAVTARRCGWWTRLAEIGRRAGAPSASAAVLEETLAAFIDEPEPGNAAEAAVVPIPTRGLSTWWVAGNTARLRGEPRTTTGLPKGDLFLELLTHRP